MRINFTYTDRKSSYGQYLPWLKENQFLSSCAYCFNSTPKPDIDHYKPKAFKSNLVNDPSNLLLSCKTCNSSSCKGDYHHEHSNRRKYKDISHPIHNIREEDIQDIFDLDTSGNISAKNNSGRANWLIAVFCLNHPQYVSTRKNLLQTIKVLKDPKKIQKLSQSDLDELKKMVSTHQLMKSIFNL